MPIPAIAQLAEHLTVEACRNQMVPGSIPGRRTFPRNRALARLATLSWLAKWLFLLVSFRVVPVIRQQQELTAVGFEPTPFRNGALSHRLRLLGQTFMHSTLPNTPS